MSNVKKHKNFTACGDSEAEQLLEGVLCEIGEALSGTGLSVFLGGSYGRGDGGVRQDRENGILYNDLDFFVFAENAPNGAEKLLRDIARKYEALLKVDVDFSRVMTVRDIRNNAARLMMQELKRGYRPVCGKDLLEEHLPALPAEELPYSEACRLLLNRGMGLLLAWEKISSGSSDTDFILRNINKAVLGGCDAVLIAAQQYRWTLDERVTAVGELISDGACKKLYADAAEFKKSPGRELKQDPQALWSAVRELFKACMISVCGKECSLLEANGKRECALKNLIKYCIKSRSIPGFPRKYMLPAVVALMPELYAALENRPEKFPVGFIFIPGKLYAALENRPEKLEHSKLYQHWLIFN
ncbi:MAG: hypothetical protein IKC65_04275 [Lentisphaeria bacterium]|nr:hypothetical protein [Lentisphaeria bacterium]